MIEISPRKQQILTVAARLFREKGFHSATMNDISVKVGMDKATLYYWIKSKESVLFEVLITRLDELLRKARNVDRSDGAAATKVRELVRLHLQEAAQYPDVMHLALREFHLLQPELKEQYLERRREYEQIWRDAIQQGADEGRFRVINNNAPTFFILGALNIFPVWFRPDGPLTAEDIADIFTDLVLGAFCADLRTEHHCLP